MKKRTCIKVVLLIAAVIGAVGWLIVRWNPASRNRLVVTTTGPLDIRLWGIRPDAGDAIYDPNGKEVGRTLGIARWDNPYWGEKSQRFDFIFELPDTNEPPTFAGMPRIAPSGEDINLRGGFGQHFFDYEGRRLLWLRASFPRTFKRWVLGGLWRSEAAFDTVDIALDYYHGPPGKALFTLKGPFELNSVISSEDTLHEVFFKDDFENTRFELSTSKRFAIDTPVAVYDTSGSRYLPRRGSSRTSPQGSRRIEYSVQGMPLKRIAAIAFGEQPLRITFKTVNLNVGGGKRRDHAPYLDEVIERLGQTVTSNNSHEPTFESAAEALKVIDLVRGSGLLRAGEAIEYRRNRGDPVDLKNLTNEQAVRLRETLNRWLTAIDPGFRAWAVRIGLKCEWPEFVEPALELLEGPLRDDYNWMTNAEKMVADALRHCDDVLSDDHIRRIANLHLDDDRRETLLPLRRLLREPKTEARIRALRELAEDDRPWLWWFAVGRLCYWKAFEARHDSLPDKLKPRVFLLQGSAAFADADQIAPRAYDLLASILTPELLTFDPSFFHDTLKRVAKKLDPQRRTAVVVNFLRCLEDFDYSTRAVADRIVKYINLWHGLDIGGLGTDVNRQTPQLQKYDWPAIIAEAIEWYDGKYKTADPNSTR